MIFSLRFKLETITAHCKALSTQEDYSMLAQRARQEHGREGGKLQRHGAAYTALRDDVDVEESQG